MDDEKSRIQRGNRIVKMHDYMKSVRRPEEDLQKKCMEIFRPRRSDILRTQQRGKRFGADVYDPTPEWALKVFCYGFVGYLSSRSLHWFSTQTENKEFMQLDEVQQYFQACDEQLYSASHNSNYYEMQVPFVQDASSGGTSAMEALRNMEENRTYFRTEHPGDVWIDVDPYGNVRRVHREVTCSALDWWTFFRADERKYLNDQIKHHATDENGNPFTMFTFIHAVYPNEDYNPNSLLAIHKKYSSDYVFVGSDSKGRQNIAVRISGRDYMPIVWRQIIETRDVYGKSLAMDALTGGRILNQFSKKRLQAAHYGVEPMLNVPKEAKRTFKRVPGAHYYYEDPMKLIKPIPQGNYAIGMEETQDFRQNIKDAFFVDFFLMLANMEHPQRTAYEISQLQGEKAILMTAICGSYQRSVLSPVLNILWDSEYDAGRMPDPPQILLDYYDGEVQPEFIGPLAQMQKELFRSRGIMSGLQAATEMMGAFPKAGAVIDEIQTMKELLDSTGFLQKCQRGDSEIQEILDQINQSEAAAQEMALARDGADMIPKLNQQIVPNSPADQLAGALQT
jgi:hypothetical protein